MPLFPRFHTARVSVVLPAAPADVWRLVGDMAIWPSWNPMVLKIERGPDRDGKQLWVAEGPFGKFPSTLEESRAPAGTQAGRHVTRIVDDELAFGGTWTWEVAPQGSGTRVTITEDGEIKSAMFRIMARVFFGYTRSQEDALRGLAKKLGHPGVAVSKDVSFPS
jgi:hypothetical protein